MSYVAPELTLIGQASGVVLGGSTVIKADPDTGGLSDPPLTSDTEW